jgi:protein-S-isoprenylcysteine O-methyltransferase Ste14
MVWASVFAGLGGMILIGGLVFGAAGRWDLPVVWAYLAVFLATIFGGNILIQRRSPGLLQQRLHMGQGDVSDWPYRLALGGGFIIHYIIAGLDIGRFHWSDSVPLAVQIIGLVAFAAGLWLGIWAATVNPFFTAEVRLQADRGQHVISAGPYQYVRHPGYSGGLAFFLASGLALGSWWSVIPMLVVVGTLIRRTALEDDLLQRNLPGYADYAGKVRYRLLPGLW